VFPAFPAARAREHRRVSSVPEPTMLPAMVPPSTFNTSDLTDGLIAPLIVPPF